MISNSVTLTKPLAAVDFSSEDSRVTNLTCQSSNDSASFRLRFSLSHILVRSRLTTHSSLIQMDLSTIRLTLTQIQK